MSENTLEKIIKKKIEKIDLLKKSISSKLLIEKIDENKSFFDFKEKIKNNINNDEIAFKMARAYATINDDKKAMKIIDSILKKQPNHKEFNKLKNSLK